MKYTLIIMLLALSSCSKNDESVVDTFNLQGRWIEIKSRLDTLSFESWDTREIMNLSRGKEMKNGYLLPKIGSGTYEYSLSGKTISLSWMLSSDANPKDYYFEVIDDTLLIGNFYGSLDGETLTFKKL